MNETYENIAVVPETVETLLDWKLPNQSEPFDEKDFFNVPDDYAEDMKSLFDRAFARGQ